MDDNYTADKLLSTALADDSVISSTHDLESGVAMETEMLQSCAQASQALLPIPS